MDICTIKAFGVFYTDVEFPDGGQTGGRRVERVELEYYISSAPDSLVTVDHQSYMPSPGTLLCTKPGQHRSSRFPFRCYYLKLDFAPDSPYLKQLREAPDFYSLIDSAKYARLFESLIHHLADGMPPSSDLVHARLLELFYCLQQDAPHNRTSVIEIGHQRKQLILAATTYIREHYAHRVTLADLAAAAGYSPNYFHHVFTAAMGVTPTQYLLDERIRQAKRLLLHPDLPLSTVAYTCGFSSQSHFTQQFRQAVGLTPAKYRRQGFGDYEV